MSCLYSLSDLYALKEDFKTSQDYLKEALDIQYLKSYANFIHIKLDKKKERFEKMLKTKNILVRKGPGVIGYEGFLRIGLGPKQEMQNLISSLRKLNS